MDFADQGCLNWKFSLFICKQVLFFKNVVKSHPVSHKDKSISTFRNICYTFLLTMSSITYYLEGGVFPVSNRGFEIVKIWRIIWNDNLTTAAAAANPDQMTITSRYLRFVLTSNSPSDSILISISMIFFEESLQRRNRRAAFSSATGIFFTFFLDILLCPFLRI